jgi:hypothetical protein
LPTKPPCESPTMTNSWRGCLLASASAWLTLTGPGGQTIEVNPSHIVSSRVPRGNEHFHADIHCLLHTADGKLITVTETCDVVRERMQDLEQQ